MNETKKKKKYIVLIKRQLHMIQWSTSFFTHKTLNHREKGTYASYGEITFQKLCQHCLARS